MKFLLGLITAVLATVVAGQSMSAVTVTAEPAPSAPGGEEPPPFSISIVTASSPDLPTPQSSTVFVTAVQPTVPAVSASPIILPPPPPLSFSPSSPAPSPSSGGSGGGGASSGGICGLGYTYCGYILQDHQGYSEEDVVEAYCTGLPDNCSGGKTKTDPIQALYICVPPDAPKVRGRQSPQPSAIGSQGPTGCANPQAGNKLQLVCSCSGQCLNPDADHIGRCDKPCS